jgi:hypothetical protein
VSVAATETGLTVYIAHLWNAVRGAAGKTGLRRCDRGHYATATDAQG